MSTKEKLLCNEPIVIDTNQNDASIHQDGKTNTLPAAMGMGGGYVPMITCYGICSYDSNAMKSSNPHSGIYEADTTRTLDLNGGNPACNQGGVAVVCYDRFNERQNGEPKETGEISPTITEVCGTSGNNTTIVVEVETEVEVRKYPVDTKALIECLQSHKTIPIREIADKLNKPKTLVEHWFRKDKCFAIPNADIWLKLKDLLGIDTDEFDASIMTFETQPGKFDMSNRIHMGNIGPTLTASGENTLYCLEGNGQRDSHKGDGYKESDVMYTLNTVEQHAVAYRKQAHPRNALEGQGYEPTNTNDTLNCTDNGESRTPTLILENHPNDSRVQISKDNKVQTLSGRMGTGGGNTPMALEQRDMIVRRLTPLECERLQGFPDGWTDIGDWYDSKGRLHKGDADSPRYKALGNSIALPFWQWMAERMVKYIDSDEPTMASLFDGIGGFPLVYSRVGCKPLWASEIEEFPIAVTKKRIGEN